MKVVRAQHLLGEGDAAGWLAPVPGAIAEEVIDLLAVLNALRVAVARGYLHDLPRPADQVNSAKSFGTSSSKSGRREDVSRSGTAVS